MEKTKVYEIVSATPQTYLAGGTPITGYLIRAKWSKYDEMIDINVPSLDKDIINTKLLQLYKQRSELDELGHIEVK